MKKYLYLGIPLCLFCNYCSIKPNSPHCFDVDAGKNLVVHSSNFTDGHISTINLDTGKIRENSFTPNNQDSIVRVIAKAVYLLTRGDANTITRFSLGNKNYCIDYEISTGTKSNPYDLVATSSGHGFLPLYNEGNIFSLDLDTGTIDANGNIIIPKSYRHPNDGPSAEPAAAYVHGTNLYVAIQHYNSMFTVNKHGELLKIDRNTRTVSENISLVENNPTSGIRHYNTGSSEELHIVNTGSFSVADANAKKYDLGSGVVSDLLTTTQMQAWTGYNDYLNINDVLQISDTLAFVSLSNGKFPLGESAVVAFNPSTSTFLGTLTTYASGFTTARMLHSNDRLYVGGLSNIKVFDTSSTSLTELATYMLSLPVYSMVIVEP